MIFSVIVPFLNEERSIEHCLLALLQQTCNAPDYELIFIDNGSTDRSAEIVQRYPVTLLHEPRQDPYLARNCGIQTAHGRFLAFTDADCIVEQDWLAQLHQCFKVSEADIVLGRLLSPSPTPRALQCYDAYYHTKLHYIYQHQLTQYYFGHAGNMAVRASVFQETGLFSAMPIVGDTDVIHQLLKRRPDAHIRYEPRARAVHTEITQLHHCLYKVFECGQYSETYSTCDSYRPLRVKDKVRVAKRCCMMHHYGLCKKMALASTLFIGFLCFEAGRWWRRSQIFLSGQHLQLPFH
jgi:glycosyltransferase involved in cell wall biosynthesis